MKRKNNHYISILEPPFKIYKIDSCNVKNFSVLNKRKYNFDVFNYICKKFKRFKLYHSMDEEFEKIFSDFTNCNINENINPYFIDIHR